MIVIKDKKGNVFGKYPNKEQADEALINHVSAENKAFYDDEKKLDKEWKDFVEEHQKHQREFREKHPHLVTISDFVIEEL